VALAYLAGARLADLEFVQFHPTALPVSGLLLTEKLRGDGAVLLDGNGERFVDELAPRDLVARAVDAQDGAWLDLRPVERGLYPTLFGRLERSGYTPCEVPVPVEPAAHYSIGGIATDLYGRSSVEGLYAAGECACTGAHGANRLASNSLLECLVFGRRAGLAALDEPPATPRTIASVVMPADAALTRHDKNMLWEHAGLIRDSNGLARLRGADGLLPQLVAACGLAREESRGVHFRSDFPSAEPRLDALHTFIDAGAEPELAPWN
jgi:L-aspartate oxidase